MIVTPLTEADVVRYLRISPVRSSVCCFDLDWLDRLFAVGLVTRVWADGVGHHAAKLASWHPTLPGVALSTVRNDWARGDVAPADVTYYRGLFSRARTAPTPEPRTPCAECNDSRVYVGLCVVEPCRTCGGSRQNACASYP